VFFKYITNTVGFVSASKNLSTGVFSGSLLVGLVEFLFGGSDERNQFGTIHRVLEEGVLQQLISWPPVFHRYLKVEEQIFITDEHLH
jgi:hypothetical protein